MTSKKSIIDYINYLYTRQIDENDFTTRIMRLKQLGNIVPKVIFDLIEIADIDKKQFLFNLLGEIGDQRIINKLRDIITNPDVDDETKLMAAVTASHLDGYFDSWLLESNLADPQSLGKKVIENMLKKSDDPYFIQMFLENFPKLVREGQFAAFEDLLLLKGDGRVVNIVGPLSELVDDELKQFIIPILVNSEDRRAFHFLQEIIKKTASKEIQNMARQAIFRLGTLIKEDAEEPEPKYKFHQAYATTCDGSGSSIYIFSVIDGNKNIKFIDFVNNDMQGIKDAFGGVFIEDEFNLFIRKLKAEHGFLTIKVTPTFILEKVKNAEELTSQAHRTLPIEYLTYRDIFMNFSYEDQEYEKSRIKFAEFKELVLAQTVELLAQTEDLFDHDEVSRSWFIDYEFMSDPIEEYLSIEVETEDVLSAKINKELKKLFSRTAKRLFKKEFLTLMVDRLNEYAFLCFVGNMKERAKLAVVAAETLFSCPPAEHPFLRRMLEHSFDVHLYDEDFLDEDLFDDYYDEYDDYDDEEEFDDEEVVTGMEYLLPHLQFHNVLGISPSEPIYPELKNLSELDKLKFLVDKAPDSSFGKFFDSEIISADMKSKIRYINYLESVYDTFIKIYAGEFDWDSFRKYFKISVLDVFENELFQDIEDVFLSNMRRHNYKSLPRKIAKRLWAETIYLTDGNLQPMAKPFSWGAGIELLVGSLIFDRTPMEILEIDYQISSSTIRKRMEQLCEILNTKVFTYPFQKLSFFNESVPF